MTSSGQSGPPAPIKAILSKFSSGKEEDKINGYLKMLKVGPDLLKFIPGEKVCINKTTDVSNSGCICIFSRSDVLGFALGWRFEMLARKL
jgi:hypothetical protein